MYKYIIVDDEFIIRKGLVKKIESLNLNLQIIGEAENGAKGIELVEKENPDIIFTDMKMPVMDGMNFLEVLNKKYVDKKVIVISAYTNYEYMHKAINSNVVGYILKPFNEEEIEELIKKAIGALDNKKAISTEINFLKEEIHEIKYQMDIEKLQSMIKAPLASTSFICFNHSDFDYLKHSRKITLMTIFTNSSVSLEDISNIQKYLNLKRKYVFMQDLEDKTQYFLITFYDKEEISYGFSYICETFEKFLFKGNRNMYICISSAKESIHDIHQAYIENFNLFQNRSMKDKTGIYVYSSVNSSEDILLWKKYKEMMHAIKSNSKDKVECLINDFFTIFENNEDCSFYSVKKACVNFNDTIANYLALMGVDVSKNFTYDFEAKYRFEISVSKIRQEFIEFYFNLLKYVHSQSMNQDELVYRIKKYIEDNFNSKITLELISSKFFINPSYCSYIYKEKTGENINEYLTKIRIEKSKELLRETCKNIDSISKEVGYRNEKYFFSIFKKYVGFTPLEYRNGFLTSK